MSSQDDDTIVLGSGLGGAGTSYTWNTAAGAGVTAIDNMNSSMLNGSITVPAGGFTVGNITTGIGVSHPYNYTTTNTSGYSFNNNNPTTVQISTDGLTMKEGADIVVGGKSLTKSIEQIEERLGILHPNPALEERWDKLKDLRKQYMEMEKDLLEKEKIMKILKES